MESFNSYLTGIDKDFLKLICMREGRLVRFEKDDYFTMAGQVSACVGYIVEGVFKYVCLSLSEGKECNTGFVFAKEFVADYPGCLYGQPSEISIQAVTACRVYVCDSDVLQSYYNEDVEAQRKARINAEQLFFQTYTRFLDLYRKTPEERYRELLHRCPQILQLVTLKEIASYLRITPVTMSKIRRKITFSS